MQSNSDILVQTGETGIPPAPGQLPVDVLGRPVADAIRAIEQTEPLPLGAHHRDLRGYLWSRQLGRDRALWTREV